MTHPAVLCLVLTAGMWERGQDGVNYFNPAYLGVVRVGYWEGGGGRHLGPEAQEQGA